LISSITSAGVQAFPRQIPSILPSRLFRKKLRFLIAALALLVTAMVTRVAADFVLPERNSHLGYAGLIWIVAAIVWAWALVPKLSLSEE